MSDLFRVKGKLVLITGSSQGLGLSMAGGFVAAGATVIINGRNPDQVNEVVKSLGHEDGKALGYVFDVTDQEAVKRNIDRIEAEAGAIDVLINNAGIHRRAPLSELTVADWQTVDWPGSPANP
jgi:gluconate 5-dehydrogenase